MADLNELAGAHLEALDAKAAAEDALKEANKVVAATELALFEGMTEEELPRITALGYNFAIDTKPRFGVVPERVDDFAEVMRELGRGGIFKFTVHAGTRDATLRELMGEHDGELPAVLEGIVTVFDQPRVGVRKAKG